MNYDYSKKEQLRHIVVVIGDHGEEIAEVAP
jgi:hypothetical protein